MGDSVDGSSSAAHRAQDSEENSQRGFFGRILNALSNDAEDTARNSAGAGVARSGFGGLSKLRTMRLSDVMVPAAEIVAVDVDIDKDALVEVFREHGFSRVPVYEQTLDRPLGLLLLKDLALRYGFNGQTGPFDLRPLLRPLIYAPPSMPLSVLLQKMQAERTHLALVIDEYGGVDGLVTFEDLLEEVVGEIDDEHDIVEGRLWLQERPGVWIVEARAPLEAFEEAIGMQLADTEDEEIDTVGGLVFMLSGRVPAEGEEIEHESGAVFEVIDAEPRRLKRLRLRLPAAAAAAAG
ncbi:magnesium/cobalt efflux protein [Haematobacter massiliensis]|uniref:Conjugal transfer protein n=1 Tax=Haematobacter massiliensis TaxID=195105 RepID=A0A086XYP3_9RHOB|nr:transporter associated domain-containing protein [Haematobacter massiliensis]KFI27143.1 conjugal transfer protein [Haematobacter massiliensis]OWJ73246.1 magnesium/cobalt efflux protein [Haematobacter massiliensis]OWJ85376.1 magnesium/cobalt efflux protein [Haematobacter massiliensis]QBJ23656.1 CBS domain-containing protein [Haematobacter massiliensis]